MSLRHFSIGLHALTASLLICGCRSSQHVGRNELDSRALSLQEEIVRPSEVPDRPSLTQANTDSRPEKGADPLMRHDVVTDATRGRGSDPFSGPKEPDSEQGQRRTVHRPTVRRDEPIELTGSHEPASDEEMIQLEFLSPSPRQLSEGTETEGAKTESHRPTSSPWLQLFGDEDAQDRTTEDRRSAATPGIAEESVLHGQMPIDFPTVIRLAGAENWGVRLAYERIAEAQANLDRAELLWVPSINLGLTYNKHDGQIQATEGEIVDVSRNSLFVGGGAVTQNAPLTGGAGGPRLFVDLSLADAYFQPLAQRQLVNAVRFQHATAFNDTLLEASVAYYELARAQGGVVVTKDNLDDAERLESLTRQFVAAGRGSEAETSRVLAEVERRRRDVIDAELAVQIASAELARILQLDPTRLAPETPLYAADDQLVPLSLVTDVAVGDLIAQAHCSRPELADRLSQIEASGELARLEEVRPFIPHLYVGASGGGFGGGTGGGVSDFSSRGDFDVAAVWKFDNLGFGNHAAVDRRESQYRQAILDYHRTRDRVSTEVLQSYHSVQASAKQIELARANVNAATDSLDRNLLRIRGLEGLPIEALQTITAVSEARQAYVDAVIDYNQAQLQLLRAIGQPLK